MLKKISKISDLVTKRNKTEYDGKILYIESKYLTTSDYDKVKFHILDAK